MHAIEISHIKVDILEALIWHCGKICRHAKICITVNIPVLNSEYWFRIIQSLKKSLTPPHPKKPQHYAILQFKLIHVLLLIILLYTVYDTVYTAVISSNKSYINSTNIYKSYKNDVEVYNSVTFYTNTTCMLQKLTIQKYFKPTPTDMLQKNTPR